MKTSAGSLNRELNLRTCSSVSFRCPARNIETALSDPNSGVKSSCEIHELVGYQIHSWWGGEGIAEKGYARNARNEVPDRLSIRTMRGKQKTGCERCYSDLACSISLATCEEGPTGSTSTICRGLRYIRSGAWSSLPRFTSTLLVSLVCGSTPVLM